MQCIQIRHIVAQSMGTRLNLHESRHPNHRSEHALINKPTQHGTQEVTARMARYNALHTGPSHMTTCSPL